MEISTKLFKHIVKSALALQEECSAEFTPDGMEIRLVDSANVALLHIYVPAAAFADYADQPGGIVGLDLNELDKVAGALDEDALTFTVTDAYLTLTGSGYDLSVPRVNPEYLTKMPAVPSIPFTTAFDIPLTDLNKVMKFVGKVSEKARFEIAPGENKVVVRAEAGNSKVNKTLTEEITSISGEPSTVILSTDYFSPALVAMAGCNSVTVQTKTNCPAQFSGSDQSGIMYSFLLAPRIEEE